MITFNNIVERFKIFAENHFFIETFSFGSPDDVDLTKFTSFPLMHLVYTGATYDPGTKTYNLEVYILDVPADKTKKVDRQKEVVSDAEQCAEDIIADIKNGGNIFLFAQDYEVVNATTTPLEEETKNVLSGVLLDLSVSIPYEWDACNAPIDGVEPGGTEITYARRGVLRMLTVDGATDVTSVRTIKVTNGTLTDDGDGVVTLDTGGVDTLAGLTDVDVTGVTNGQVIAYNNGVWENADDAGGAEQLDDLTDVSLATPANREALIYDGDNWVNDNVSKADVGLGNVDNTSDADKPVSSATQTALDAKADTSAVPTELNDLSDVSISGTPAGNEALIFDTATSSFKSLPNYTNRFEDEVEIGLQMPSVFFERGYSVKAEGDGIFIDPSSDTPATGKVIQRKIYHKAGFISDDDVIGDYTLIHTFADNTAYADTVTVFDAFENGATYGTPPFTLVQSWEEVAQAPAFTGLLNESYGSGAEAAYSTRRLNGNVTECMVIRRASDSTTTTIGFDSEGNIDEAAIETFCSGTSCTVSEWKDQSGNGNDATAAASGNEPTIYTGGALVKENGKVAVEFDGTSSLLEFDLTTGVQSGGYWNAFHVMQSSDTTGILMSSRSITHGWYMISQASTNTSTHAGMTTSTGALNESDVYWKNGTQQISTLDRTNMTSAFFDGNQVLFNFIGATTSGNDFTDWQIGGYYTSGFEFGGVVQEIVIYQSDKSSVRTSIEENIGDYFTQNTPLLDTYSGAAAAYSLRKLSSTYSGPAIRVRRSNDNAEIDVNFNVFGELDTVSLAAHCGSNDGFVKTWYSQTGSNDATQTTAANQPKIYDGTTGVVTENGKPAVEFDGSNDGYLLDTTGLDIGSLSSFTVGRMITISSNVMLALSGSTDNRRWYAPFISGGNFNYGYADSSTAITTTQDTNQNLHTMIAGTTLGGVEAWKNGTSAGTDTRTTGATNALNGIGNLNSAFYANCNVQEVIFYGSDQSSNRTNIEDNINTFYNIYS